LEKFREFARNGTTPSWSRNDNLFYNNDVTPPPVWLWISEATYLNNDCIDSNVSIQYFGDIMMIRAFKPISAGEQITIAYREPENKV